MNILTSIGVTASVLVDSGSTTNFISKRFCFKNRIAARKISKVQIVKLADGSTQPTSSIVTTVAMYINNQKVRENLLVFPIGSYDIILGMPFLKKYNPTINWNDNTLTFTENQKKNQINDILMNIAKENKNLENVIIKKKFTHSIILPTTPPIPIENKMIENENNTINEKRKIRRQKRTENKLKYKKNQITNEITNKSKNEKKNTYEVCHFTKRDIRKISKSNNEHLFLLHIRPKKKVNYLANEMNNLNNTTSANANDNSNYNKENPIDDKYEMKMNTLRQRYIDVFPEELPKGLPPKRILDHKINLIPDSKPTFKNYYRMSPKDLEEVKEHLKEMLDQGFIRESHSPYGAPVLFALKPGETKRRFCVDYRDLNKITVKDRYPIPRVDDLIEQLHGAKYFTKIDLRSGYFQVRIDPNDIEKTAFVTRYGQYEFLVLPFGLTAAPSTFVAIMNDVFKEYTDQFVVVYLDDILIYSKTAEEHLNHVQLVLDKLRINKLYAKEKKCEFMKRSVKFVGFIVSERGLEVDNVKVQAVQDWPVPQSIKDVRSFLGFVSYYRKFIRNHSEIVAPISELTKTVTSTNTTNKFIWPLEAQTAFEKMKVAMSSAPVLVLPDATLPYVINTDASGFAIGACIMQDHGNGLQPIAFMSKKMLAAERNYPVHHKELLAIIVALKTWRHLVHGAQCVVRVITDHKSIVHLQTQPKLSERQVRWNEFLAEFGNDLQIEYQAGKTNVVADALSRRADHIDASDSVTDTTDEIHNLTVININLKEQIKEQYENDLITKEILKIGARKVSRRTDQHITVRDGIIYYDNTRIYIPDNENLKITLISEHHDNKLSAHFGSEKVIKFIERNYYWPKLREDIRLYIKTCLICQRIKPSNKKKAGLLFPLPIPNKKWQSASMDFITQLPRSANGYDAIMVVCDRLSKEAIFVEMHTTATAPQVAQLYFNHVCRRRGFPQSIVSDRDSKFTSLFWQALWKLFDTRLNMSTAFHPQTDGQTERTNRTLEQVLRAFVNEKQDNWDELLAYAEMAYNNAIQSSTGFSPYYINNGEHMMLPSALITVDENNNKKDNVSSNNEKVEEMVSRMRDTMELMKENLKIAQSRQKKNADENRREEEYEVGDKVLLSTADLKYTEGQKKLLDKQIGPYEIIQKISAVAYKLLLPTRLSRIHPVFHISKLLPYNDTDKFQIRQQENRPPPVLTVDDEPAWYVEKIINKRKKKGVLEYLVKWENFPNWENTWEPISNLKQAKETIQQYESEQ